MTSNEVDSFLIASGQAKAAHGKKRVPPRDPYDLNNFLATMKARHPIRINRLAGDVAWLKRQARKHGIDPQEVRWLL